MKLLIVSPEKQAQTENLLYDVCFQFTGLADV